MLDRAAQFWYLVAATGMWLFVVYIVAFYFGATFTGDFASWNDNRFLSHGHVPGDTAGNLMFAAHVLLAGVLTAGGTVQLIPQLRQHALAVHRWNGRVFMIAALLVTIAGLGLNLLRGVDETVGEWPSPIDFNGVLILVCLIAAWIFVRRGEIAAHRRWALRTFMVVSGVWFLRVGVSSWILLTATLYGEPRGFSEFFAVWMWGCFLVPLAVLELYLWAQSRGSPLAQNLVAGLLMVLTLFMGVGIFAAWKMFWGPLL